MPPCCAQAEATVCSQGSINLEGACPADFNWANLLLTVQERGERQALQPPGSRQPSPRACDRRWISSANHGHAHAGTGPQGTGEGAPARHLLWGIYF